MPTPVNILLTVVAAGLIGLTPAFGQNVTSFRTYRCTDRTQLIVAFYPYDSRAYVQIDGGEVTLPRRIALWGGERYSRGGITLRVGKTGRITVKRRLRAETDCELEEPR
jgi:membrane-bound inhibitor of C-type lysozyme